MNRYKIAALRFRWRAGLGAGMVLKRLASRMQIAGDRIISHSAWNWYRPEFHPKAHAQQASTVSTRCYECNKPLPAEDLKCFKTHCDRCGSSLRAHGIRV